MKIKSWTNYYYFFIIFSILLKLGVCDDIITCNFSLNVTADNDNCTSPDTDCGSLQMVLEKVYMNKNCNVSIIHIAPGIYKGEQNRNISINLEPYQKIRFESDILESAIFDGEYQFPIMEVLSGTVEFSGIIFQNGYSIIHEEIEEFIYGGGCLQIDNNSTQNLVANCTFLNCYVTSTYVSVFGGALWSRASVDIISSTFRNCSADGGGGALYVGLEPSTIEHCHFAENKAIEYPGGAIYGNDLKSISIKHSIFRNNHGYTGGGIHIIDSMIIELSNNSFEHNMAVDMGGGAYLSGRDLNISDSRLNENRADLGAGLYLEIFSYTNILINNVHISNNKAIKGGGIYCDSESPLNSTFITGLTLRTNNADNCDDTDVAGTCANSLFSQCAKHDIAMNCMECADNNCVIDSNGDNHCFQPVSTTCLCHTTLANTIDIIIQIISGSVCFVMIAIIACLYFSNWADTERLNEI